MNGIFRVQKVTGFRQFQGKNNNGNPETVDVVGVVLRQGTSDIYAEAYRKQHDKIKEANLAPGDLVGCRLSSYVQERTKDGTVYISTQFVIDDIDVWLSNSPQTF